MTAREEPTKDRLIDAGLRLFASKGFSATTVGDIEAAVGLAPRRGALYRHFPSKQALLEAAVERKVVELEMLSGFVELLPIGDLRAELTLMSRWLLMELGRQRDLINTLEQVGDEYPELVEMFWSRVQSVTYEQAAEASRRHFKDRLETLEVDLDVLSALVVGAVVNYRRSQWTFGHAPLDLDEDRFVAGVVELLSRPFELLAEPEEDR
jgi:AcrR family transcriptional regulator